MSAHRTLILPGLILAALCAVNCRSSFGQFDESADLIPGLIATYESGDQRVERIDVDLSYHWGDDTPDSRIPSGPFTAKWSTGLLIRDEGTFTLHAYLQGAVTVELDGETVLEASQDEPGWAHGESFEPDFGLLELTVKFRKTAKSARLQLFWSSDKFPLEPLPPHLLYREEGRPDLAIIETGRKLFSAHRCNRCHLREHDSPSFAAPGLYHATTGLNRDWLVTKLLDRNPESAHAKMPSFGFSEDEATDVAAWIEYFAGPADLMPTPKDKPIKNNDPGNGEVLVKSVGCLACHVINDVGKSGPFGGGDLSHIGAKRTSDWFSTWLASPERLNVQHRMPVFALTPTERGRIARYLASLRRDNEGNESGDAKGDAGFDEIKQQGKRETEQVKRGRELAKKSRCANCHKIPAMEVSETPLPTLSAPIASWDDSCLGKQADRKTGRPFYPRIDRDAVIAYVNSRSQRELSPPGMFARGQHRLDVRNCLGCHERDLTQGMIATAGTLAQSIEELRGQSQALIPPAITAVGDKLHEAALTRAVVGQPDPVRLPWLKVRMPKFNHNKQALTDLVSYLISHDRIPANAGEWASDGRQPTDASAANSVTKSDSTSQGADAPRSPDDLRSPVDAQTLVIGRTLVGSGGFNCIACHVFGEYEPRNVALGTRGSDLKQIDKRVREVFFHRWTRDPLRVVPGMEMPSIKKPVDGVLDGDLDKQLAAVWAAINDPSFTAPPNPAQVEQHIVLQPGDAPRIIRDVFNVSEANGGGHVPRGIAMGFDNGHSLLFDIDNFCVRGWTFGDFAQQRTEGKSWYWDLAGVEPVGGFDLKPDVTLLASGSDDNDPTSAMPPKSVQLVEYDSDGVSVRLVCKLTFVIDDRDVDVLVVQSFRPWSDESVGATGITRSIVVGDLPGGYVSRLSVDRLQGPLSQIIGGEAVAGDDTVPSRKGDPEWRHHVFYTSRLSQPPLIPKPRPEMPRNDAPVTTLPGFVGQRLKFPSSVMPTAFGWTTDGTMAFTSLKGDVFLATDSDGDGIEDSLSLFEEGLAAPFGLLADGDALLVAHKPELLRLRDTNGDGRADERVVVASGWGYTDNYHDWLTGPVRDSEGNLYLGLGSDYSQPKRPAEIARWRGKILKVDPSGHVEPIAHELRYPTGIAIDSRDRLFVTDQQGVANTFNEINYILPGRHYGVEAAHEEDRDAPETRAAVQVPHPWTRSVNGLTAIPDDINGPLKPFAGHLIGCEYNNKFLIRASLQEVDGELQGATYDFTRPTWDDEANTFLGPMSIALGPTGDLYVGSIHDSGWLSGQNTGEIVRLSPSGDGLPNGIRELRATSTGFEIEFLRPVDAARATDAANYSLSGYTRVWEGSYASPDSGRYSPQVESATLSADARTVTLTIDKLRPTYVYEVNCTKLDESLFPATGHYTMNRIPDK